MYSHVYVLVFQAACGSILHTGIVKGGRDVVMFLSHSGNTEECVRAAYHLGARGVCTITITGGRGELYMNAGSYRLTT